MNFITIKAIFVILLLLTSCLLKFYKHIIVVFQANYMYFFPHGSVGIKYFYLSSMQNMSKVKVL